jgi:hypothetical protein
MIINDFQFFGTQRSIRPPKADPPLIVNANRKLSGAVTFECFQPIPWQCRQISQTRRRLKPVKTHLSLPCKAGELPDMPSGGKSLGGFNPIADNHGNGNLAGITGYVNSNLIHRYR